MNKYKQLSILLEQQRGPYEPGTEFLNLSKTYSSLKADCQNKCRTSRDVLCIHKCHVDAAKDTLRQSAQMMTRTSQIPEPKKREKQRIKLQKQIQNMRERLKLDQKILDKERQKARGGYNQGRQEVQ